MTYTWGYIKENTLAKLNLDEEEANQQNFLSRFPYYANTSMSPAYTAATVRASLTPRSTASSRM